MNRSKFRGPSPDSSSNSSRDDDDDNRKTERMKFDAKNLKNIKVAIKRKIPGAGKSDDIPEIDHSLDNPENIKIHRKHGEGSRPIFQRQDIVVNQESEHRSISSRRSPHGSSSRRNRSGSRSRASRSRRRTRSRSRSRSKSESRSSRRELDERSNNRERRSRDRSDYRRRSRDRSYDRHSRSDRRSNRERYRSRSPHYRRSPPRRRSRSPAHLRPINPNALGAIPFIIPQPDYYGPENGIWYHAPLRAPAPMMIPPGMIPPGPPRYRFPPVYGARPPPPPMYHPRARPPHPRLPQTRTATERSTQPPT